MIRLLEEASKEAPEEKVKGRGGDVWKTSAWSGGATVVPLASTFVDDWLITKQFKCYKTELGIPEEESDSSSTGLFTHYCYANEVGRHTKPSKFWSDDGIQRTP